MSALCLLVNGPNIAETITGCVCHPPNLIKGEKERTLNHIEETLGKLYNKHMNVNIVLTGYFKRLRLDDIHQTVGLQQKVDFMK